MGGPFFSCPMTWIQRVLFRRRLPPRGHAAQQRCRMAALGAALSRNLFRNPM